MIRRFDAFFRHWQNALGLALVLAFVIMAVFAPQISPQDPKEPGPYKRVEGLKRTDRNPHPPAEFPPLGSLPGQWDVFHSIVWGSRDAIEFGLKVTLSAAVLGVIIGATAAWFGGTINSLLMRISDSFLTFPIIAGVVLLQQLWQTTLEAAGGVYYNGMTVNEPTGNLGLIQIVLANINPLTLTLIIFSWMPYARLTNSMVMTIKQSDFVQAARALGAGHIRTIFRHLIPNALSPAIVLAARDIGSLVILQATFTFIGLGGESVWGGMLSMGRNWILGPNGSLFTYWWVYIPATLTLMLFGIAWNLLGDGLNEVFGIHNRDI